MNYNTLLERYRTGRITIPLLKMYVKKGIITQEQFETIISENEEQEN